tara:strand:+ start:3893 stop:4804 length:912 start_codon:yes stop_codon:yes gene_type:complete
MTTGTKITLWSIGGLVVATGLFFGIRALIRTAKNNGGGNIPPPPPPPNGTTPPPPPPPQEPKVRGGLFPIRYGDSGAHVEAWQKAINKWDDDWCSASMCHAGMWRNKINVDGDFGEQTALYTNCHYPETDCALCPVFGTGATYPVGSADYSQCKVTWDKFKSVVGSTTANKFKSFTGEDQFQEGQTNNQILARGGCPCDKAHPECCMPDYVDVSTLSDAPYSNAAGDPFGFGFKRTGGAGQVTGGIPGDDGCCRRHGSCPDGMTCTGCQCTRPADMVRGGGLRSPFSGEVTNDGYLNMFKGFN